MILKGMSHGDVRIFHSFEIDRRCSFHGPRIGCLFVRGLGDDKPDPFLSNPTSNTDSAPFVPLFLGGGQECGFRSGTENTPMIAGLGEAAKLISANLTAYAKHMLQMRQFLEQQLREAFPSTDPNSVCIFGLDRCQAAEANSSPRSDSTSPLRERFPRLPNTVNITFRGPPFLNSRSILALCPNLLASRGAACHSGLENSSVLHAVGYTLKESSSAIRLSVGRYTTKDEILEAVASIRNAVSMLRSTENSTY
ncbi:unnamed protein product [Dicrocoelium dendriticum]|nr:unnamed protein product [Dicrocoelium dendriticum]